MSARLSHGRHLAGAAGSHEIRPKAMLVVHMVWA